MPHATTISELPPDQPAGFAARHLFGAGAVDRARDVLELIETWRPDLVIHEMIEWGRRRARQPPDEITADAIAGTLDRLLNEPSFQKTANLLRDDRVPAPAAVLDEIRPHGG